MAELLIGARADINDTGLVHYSVSPLSAAVDTYEDDSPIENPGMGIIDYLLAQGADVDGPVSAHSFCLNDRAYQPGCAPSLIQACLKTHTFSIKLVKRLLDAGANANLQSAFGMTVIDYLRSRPQTLNLARAIELIETY